MKLKILLLYLILYALIFIQVRHGLGQFWDITFPYFSSQIGQILLTHAFSWNTVNLGEPLGYASDIFFRFILSLFSFLKPEYLLYSFIVSFSTITSFLGFATCYKYNKNILLSLLVGFAIILNPGIFYKIEAGHFAYLASYLCFVGILYFLLNRNSLTFKDGVVLSLLYTFSGVSIHFFVINYILILLRCIDKYSKKVSQIILIMSGIGIVALLINLSWLTNFLFSIQNISNLAMNANSIAFDDSSFTSFYNIFSFLLSKASYTQYYYNPALLSILGLLLYVVYILHSFLMKKSLRKFSFLHVFLLIIIFITSGLFNYIPLPYLKTLYPMFRETGHTGVVAIYIVILLVGLSLYNNKRSIYLISLLLTLFVGYNVVLFSTKLPYTNYSLIRKDFEPYYNFIQQNKGNNGYRYSTYPFWGQYSFKNIKSNRQLGLFLNNVGYDSFIKYSGIDYLENNISPSKVMSSYQMELIDKRDIEIFSKLGVRYIFDFSHIYESNFDHYVPSAVYGAQEWKIKNIRGFLDGLTGVNKIKDNIYEINSYTPIINGNFLTLSSIKINPTKYRISLTLSPYSIDNELNFLQSFHPEWKLYPDTTKKRETEKESYTFFEGEELSYLRKKPLRDESHTMVNDYANGWMIDTKAKANAKANETYLEQGLREGWIATNPDGSYQVSLTLYFRPQSRFYLGLGVSGFTFLSLIAWLLWNMRRKKSLEMVK